MADDMERPPRGYDTKTVHQLRDEDLRATGKRRRSKGKLFLLGLVLTPLILFALWATITLNISYSEGERGGYVQKFSHKGWLCKTWEGELGIINVPGTLQQTFEFTVRDDNVARQIQDAVRSGRRIALHYKQHKGVPTRCFGETQYYVTEVEVMPDVPGAPGTPAIPTAPVPPAAPAGSPATTPPAAPPAAPPRP